MDHSLGVRVGALFSARTPVAASALPLVEPVPELIFTGMVRYAMRYSAALVRELLPAGVSGAYLMFNGSAPVYVGRSDACLRTRLSTHPLLGVATHVLWEPTKSAFHAFVLECDWYHRLESSPARLNVIHPARPGGSERVCAFCAEEVEALRVTLSTLYKSTA